MTWDLGQFNIIFYLQETNSYKKEKKMLNKI